MPAHSSLRLHLSTLYDLDLASVVFVPCVIPTDDRLPRSWSYRPYAVLVQATLEEPDVSIGLKDQITAPHLRKRQCQR
ncbi:hypothetical protein VTK26DRAFT_6162 [Humicola hyalothermophila]